jgi:signal transduction histidine kinase
VSACVFAQQFVKVSVQDSGAGIDSDDLPHVFERFYRAGKVRSSQIPGAGLGLAIARAIADANGGTLNAQNAPEGGALFELVLPLGKGPLTRHSANMR